MNRAFLLLGAVISFWVMPPEALSLRCGTELISPGDRQYEVLARCGEPDHRQIRDEERYFRFFREGRFIEYLQEVEVEEWTYNLGPDRFIRILRFENGVLDEIETGDYGWLER